MLEPHLDGLDEPHRAAVLQDWARSEYLLDNDGSLDILDKAIDLHRAIGDDVALAEALTFAVRINETHGRPDAAMHCADEALELLEGHPADAPRAAALNQRGWLAMMRWDYDVAIDYAERASIVAMSAGDEPGIVQSMMTRGVVQLARGDPDGAALLEQARVRAEVDGQRFNEVRALIHTNAAAMLNVDLHLAEDAARRAITTAARYEISMLEAFGKLQLAEVLLAKGDWPAAEDLTGDGLDSRPHSQAYAGFVLGRIQVRCGRAGAAGTIARAWADAEAGRELQQLLPSAGVVAEYMWLTGDETVVAPSRLVEVLHLATGPATAWARGNLAWWLLLHGTIDELPADVLAPYRWAAAGHLARASAAWSRLGLPYEQAITLATGSNDDRQAALDALESLGATAVAAKIRQQLRADGVVPRRGRSRAARQHTAGLTTRQAEVLDLLVEGRTNNEIADQLFVSPRTVEHHVSAVLTKLDAPTRQQAAARARQLGIPTR